MRIFVKLLFLNLVLILYSLPSASLWAQPDSLPDVNQFVMADSEPEPLNMDDIREAIGYPESAIKRNVEGTVVFRVLVDKEGHYVRHKVLIPVDTALVNAIENHIAELNFSPAFLEGVAIPFWMNIPFTFRLVEDENQNALAMIALLDSLIEKEPDNYEYYVKRGLQHRNLGNYEKAFDDFSASIEHNPRINKRKKNSYPFLYYAYFGRGTVSSLQSNYEDARRDFSLAKTTLEEIKKPDSALVASLPNLFLERAYASTNLGDLKNALKDYEWVIENAPELQCTTWPMMMEAALTEKNYDLVLRSLDGQIECYPEAPTLHYTRAYYRIKAGDPSGALVDLDTVLVRNNTPELRIAAFNLKALAYINLEELDRARESVEAALLINVLNPFAYYYRGLIEEKEEDLAAACKSWQRAVNYGLEGAELKKIEEKMARLCPISDE